MKVFLNHTLQILHINSSLYSRTYAFTLNYNALLTNDLCCLLKIIIVDVFTVLLPSTGHGADYTENTSHVIPIQRVHWRADSCLTASYNIRPIAACAYRVAVT
jgi:hypothetical protein